MLRWGVTRVARCTFVPALNRRIATFTDEVRSDSTFHIPIVDFSAFRNAKSPVDKERTARKIVGAFKEVQFEQCLFFSLGRDGKFLGRICVSQGPWSARYDRERCVPEGDHDMLIDTRVSSWGL